MATVLEALREALAHHQRGELRSAETIYRRILERQPDHADALHLLGVLEHQTGRHEQAIERIGRAIELNRSVAAYHNNLGEAYRALGRLDEARSRYLEALRLQPDYAEAHNNLGLVNQACGDLDEAQRAYDRALRLAPEFADAHLNLGTVHQQRGDIIPARDCYERAVAIEPNLAEAHNNLGTLLKDQGRVDEAIERYERSLSVDPGYADANVNLGSAHRDRGDLHSAVACYRRALELMPAPPCPESARDADRRGALPPEDAEAAAYGRDVRAACHGNLGMALKALGNVEEARKSYATALRSAPKNLLWAVRVDALCPTVFPSAEAIGEYRRRLEAALDRYGDARHRFDLDDIPTSGAEPSFNLQFHGVDERPMREKYASVFATHFAQRQPLRPTGRPKLGFVVTDRHEHSFIKNVQSMLNRFSHGRLRLTIVASPRGCEKIRAAVSHPDVDFLPMPKRFSALVDAVRDARFDLLYYREIGTDSINYFLPFLRLAPVQCTSFGIQVTSGIPTMDHYLSSDSVEPDDAQDHYTESLVRLKTMLTYQRPFVLYRPTKTRNDFGFRTDDHLYLCAQQIGKFHPDYDPMLAEILRRDRHASIIITKGTVAAETAQLEQRFATTIADVADRIVFVPSQAGADYHSLVRMADVVLDPLHFGGMNTTYDALGQGKPIVTLPSKYHRGRYALGCYRKMGVLDCVASTPEHYVELAVSLATDRDFDREVRRKLGEASDRLFEDSRTAPELEECLTELALTGREQ